MDLLLTRLQDAALSRKLLLQMAPSLLLAGDPRSASPKIYSILQFRNYNRRELFTQTVIVLT